MKEIRPRYNGVGWTGILLLFAGLILSSWKHDVVLGLAVDRYGTRQIATGADALLLLVGLCLLVVAVLMILIGRTYEIWDDPNDRRN